MASGLLNAFGGLGVFLLGMIVMTDSLKACTGNALRKALAKFTRSPTSGAVTGAISTAIIQSSSATTVTAVGFVGAGLITFSQSLGIIFGANIGTTITGWLVAIVGFKLKIGTLALPLVLLGVLMHLFLRRRLSAFGLALAGFGMIFVGIDLIQSGLAGLEGVLTPDTFPGDHFGGRLLLLLIGIGITLVTQSSSAGVATALAAVHAGTINFEQAVVMVIGMDVGTTATAALATIGGSPDVRRTGFAHVIYNCLTGVMAFMMVTPYSWTISSLFPATLSENPEIALVGFHTFFNTLGVIVVLPIAGAFARLMFWLVPDQPNELAQRLDRSLYQSPAIAMDAVHATLRDLSAEVFALLNEILENGQTTAIQDALKEANLALKTTRDYITPIDTSGVHEDLYSRKLVAIHSLDHLRRLIDRCQESKRSQRAREQGLHPLGETLQKAVLQASSQVKALKDELVLANGKSSQSALEQLEQVSREFELQASGFRNSLVGEAAAGKKDTVSTIQSLDTLRWIRRVSYHVWRIVYYLTGGRAEVRIDDLNTEPEPTDDDLSGSNFDQ